MAVQSFAGATDLLRQEEQEPQEQEEEAQDVQHQEELEPAIPAELLVGDWSVQVVVPRGNGKCRIFSIGCDPKDTGEKVKEKIEKVVRIPTDDLELFSRNTDVEGSKQKWLNERDSLKEQGVHDGAQITVGVHGMRGDTPAVDPDTGDVPNDAVTTSVYTKGQTSYYHATARKHQDNLTEEQRIVSGGDPQKLEGAQEKQLEPFRKSTVSKLIDGNDVEESGKPEKPIFNYAWGDEKEFIKIYIEKGNEPEVIQLAGDGKDGQVEVKWLPKSLKLVVHGPLHDLVLIIEHIYYEIVPDKCKFRVSEGKRITLSLKKLENFTWLKLIKPQPK